MTVVRVRWTFDVTGPVSQSHHARPQKGRATMAFVIEAWWSATFNGQGRLDMAALTGLPERLTGRIRWTFDVTRAAPPSSTTPGHRRAGLRWSSWDS
ncbi:MAG TPA: hypothetical protein VFB34_07735 [Chloroflexota bacterium]|nr:hypothetical protein [Chloroflexota bacterium]